MRCWPMSLLSGLLVLSTRSITAALIQPSFTQLPPPLPLPDSG